MSISENDIQIVGSEATWRINQQGDIQGLYTGTFKFKCFLSPLDRISADREYRQLMGEHSSMAAQHEALIAYALSQLKYRIVSAPPFWNSESGSPGNIPDDNIIETVLDAAIQSEIKYRKSLKKTMVEVLTKAKAHAEQIADRAAIDEEVEDDDRKNTSEDE